MMNHTVTKTRQKKVKNMQAVTTHTLQVKVTRKKKSPYKEFPIQT
jgi:hypothetical protein